MTHAFTQHLIDESGTRTRLAVALRWNPRRRTRAAFHFQPDGSVLVEAPANMGVDEVRRLLRTHSRWLLRRRRTAKRPVVWFPAQYADGAVLFFRGRALSLRLAQRDDIELRDAELIAPATATKAQVWRWYAHQADAVLGGAVVKVAARLPWLTAAPPWRHRYMTSRWGSFSSRGRMSLNTHLVKLADPLVEYVVTHELCHAKHLNHGPRFQRLLDISLADWRQRRAELHQHGGLLMEPAPENDG